LLAIGLTGRSPEIWSIADGKMIESIELGKVPADADTNVVWSSDENSLIVSVGNGQTTSLFARYDRASKKTTPILPAYPKRLWHLKKIGGNRSLVMNQTREGHGEFAIVDMQGKMQALRDFAKQDLFGAAAATDGSLMAAQVDKAFVVYDSQGQLVHRHEPKEAGAGFSLAFSPDGKRLAMVSFKKIEILDLAGKLVVATFTGKFPHPEAFYSPDGKHLVLVGEKLVILDAESGAVKTENGVAQGITAAYAPNGQDIAIARMGQEANIVDCWSMTLPVDKSLVPAVPVIAQNPVQNPMAGAAGQVKQSTPEETFETYQRSLVSGDYDTFFKVTDEDMQFYYLRSWVSLLAEEGFVGKKDPKYQEYVNGRRDFYKSYGLRDLNQYAGKDYEPTPEDIKAIQAIPDKLTCIKKFYGYLKPKKRFQDLMARYETAKIERKETVGPYVVIHLSQKDKQGGLARYFYAMEQTPQGWRVSKKVADSIDKVKADERKKAEEQRIASLQVAKVELKLGTPEETVQTYRNAVMGNDWGTVIQTLDAESQIGVLRKTFHDLGYTGFSGKNQAEIDAQQKEQRALLKKYSVVTDSNQDIAKNKNLLTPEQRRECFAEIRGWLVQHEKTNEQGEAFRQQQLQLAGKEGDAKSVTLNYKPVEFKQYRETRTEYPTYVVKENKGQWFIDLHAGQRISAEREKFSNDELDKQSTAGIRLRHRLIIATKKEKDNGDEPPLNYGPVGYSADSKYLVLSGTGRPFEVWNIVEGKRVSQLHVNKIGNEYDRSTCASLSPDGKYLAVSTSPYAEKRVHGIYSFKDKRVLNTFPNTKNETSDFVWLGNDRLCVIQDSEADNVIMGSIPTWKAAVTASAKHSRYQPLAIARTGEIAISGGEQWKLLDAQGKAVTGFPLDNKIVQSLAFSPDGQQLAIAWDEGISLLKLSGMQLTQFLPKTDGRVQKLCFTPDGKKLYVMAQKIMVYDIESKQLVASGGTAYYEPIVSPDGRVIATTDVDGTVRIWDLTIELGPPLYPPEIPTENYFEAAASATKEPAAVPKAAAKTPAMRHWTSADGKFKIEAEFVQQKQGFVQLKRKDTGALVSIPIEKLGAAEQEFLKTLP
jgi:WD40 repeat protein